MPLKIREFFARADIKEGKSSIVRPLYLVIFIIAATLVGVVRFTNETNLSSFPAIKYLVLLLFLVVGLFLLIYIVLLIKNPESLRSWSASFRGTEIRTGAIGDDLQGRVLKNLKNLRRLPVIDPRNGEDQ